MTCQLDSMIYTSYPTDISTPQYTSPSCTENAGIFGIQTETSNNTTSSKRLPIEPSWKPNDPHEKPPYSYATMIAHAILCSDDRKLTLSDIYRWIATNYPYYSLNNHGWQNSIRHNLSLNKSFVKMGKSGTETSPRKGCYWTVREGHEKPFMNNLVKRNNAKRQSSICYQSTSVRQSRRRRSSSSSSSTENITVLTSVAKRRKYADDSQDSDCDSAIDLESTASSVKTGEMKEPGYDISPAMANLWHQMLFDEQACYTQISLGNSLGTYLPKSDYYCHDILGHTDKGSPMMTEHRSLFGVGPATANLVNSLDWPF